MIFDWLARESWMVVSWWLIVTVAGVAVYPFLVRLLGGLPDKGYTLARVAGLLVVSFVYWLLATLGFLRNTPGGILLAWLLVLMGGLVFYWRGPRLDWRAWWRENRRVIIVGEILFLVLLFGWAMYRAHINETFTTEKPMELMMMSSVIRSETFPPNDGWLAGYAISYYYFGYVMAGMLAMVSGVSSTTGFNLMIALLFALTGLTAFGVVYNLVRSRYPGESPFFRAPLLVGLLGGVFVVLLGNFQLPLIELPYQTHTASDAYLGFWGQDQRFIARPPLPDGQTVELAQWESWWWFRASRVVTDTDLHGNLIGVQPIDEFPQFSFLLADMHPHVLALPFAVLALGLAFNVILTWRDPTRAEVIFYGLCLGGLVFLNTWDGPIYMAMLLGADAVRRLMRNGNGRLRGMDWWRLVLLGLSLLGLTVILYFPFLISFRSQAGGVLPNLLYPTAFQLYFVMFGPFLLILSPFLVIEIWRARDRMNWRLGLMAAGGLLLALLLIVLVLVLAGTLVPQLRSAALGFVDQNGGWEAVLPALLGKRLAYIPTTLVLLAGIVVIVGRLFPRVPPMPEVEDGAIAIRQITTYPPGTAFALLLVGAGLVLTLVPDYLYLRDNFSVRINTVFKFYYQAWLMFGLAGAYAVYSMLADVRLPQPVPVVRALLTAVTGGVLVLGLLYPVFGIQYRATMEGFRTLNIGYSQLTMDSGLGFLRGANEDYSAISCLGASIAGDHVVAVEALGGAYDSAFGRIAALTGIPILLGWENHEGQWRGPTYSMVVGTRPADIEELYTDLRWEVAEEIIQRYGIDYIFYGSSERLKYGVVGEEKFAANLETVCDTGSSRFYRVNPTTVAARG